MELEEQSEQLDGEILDVDLEIEITKQEAVNAGALSAALTTFVICIWKPHPKSNTNSYSFESISWCGPLTRSAFHSSMGRTPQ